MVERAPQYIDQKAKDFFVTAISEGAHFKLPNQQITQEQWVRRRNILGSYIASSATLEELAELYRKPDGTSTSRQNIQQTIQATIVQIHENCTTETLQKFPLAEINLHKPRSEERAFR